MAKQKKKKPAIQQATPAKENHRPRRFTHDQVLQAIRGSGGIKMVIYGEKRLNCSRGTLAIYLKRYPDLEDALNEEREQVLDVSEAVVIKNIQLAAEQQNFGRIVDSNDARWYLSLKGRDRGYGQVVTHRDINYEIFSTEELDRIIAGEDEGAVYADALRRMSEMNDKGKSA